MVAEMKIRPSFVFVGLLMLYFSKEAYAMSCDTALGITLSCPTVFNNDDKAFCCYSQSNLPYCCDIGEFIGNNTAVIAGVAVAGLILVLIITLCCCCFCSCCMLFKRRVNRGTVYGQVPARQPASTAYPLQTATVVHAPPPSTAYPSCPSYPPYPQPPMNPNYPHPN